MTSQMRMLAVYALSLVLLCTLTNGFYLPGVAPKDIPTGSPFGIKVNSLTSSATSLPVEYYSLPVCAPNEIRARPENLGEVLRGDRIYSSPYQIEMRADKECQVVCKKGPLGEAESKHLKTLIDNGYRVNMILDNLPAAVVRLVEEKGATRRAYERGFPLGKANEDETYNINNHISFTVLYNPNAGGDTARIVGFEVEPASVRHTLNEKWNEQGKPSLSTCSGDSHPLRGSSVVNLRPQPVETNEEITFTYDVSFIQSAIPWANRWDQYLQMGSTDVHWFSVLNSVMVVAFLSTLVGLILIRALRRDIVAYNQLETAEEAADETGWKLVHGDVLRPPPHAGALAVSVATGVQILCMAFLTMVFATLGFLSPANRGSLGTALVLLFVLMGTPAGYTSARLLRLMSVPNWKSATLKASTAFPGLCFLVLFLVNLLLWQGESSMAVPFGTLCALCFLWFGVSAPLVFLGSFFGFKANAVEMPVRVNKIPRWVPAQPWYFHPLVTCLIGGTLPFGTVFIELFFILSSLWLHKVYYMFGVLFIVFLVLIVTCAEVSIVLCYFHLTCEDYRWWWRSFMTASFSGLYVFLYSTYYFFSRLEMNFFTSTVLYFSYMGLLSVAFALLTGAVGFLSTLAFVRTIYQSVKID